MSTTTARRPGTAGSDRTRLLEFVERQARPARLGIELDGDGRVPVPVPGRGAAVPLPESGWRLLDQPAWPGCAVPASTPTSQRVLATLGSCGVQRYESRSAVNPHRGYAAAHCFFSAQVLVLAGGEVWHLDTSAEALRGLGGAGEGPAAAIDADGGAVLAVVVHPGSIPPRYRELRWALGLCEAGHLTELLVQVARALGLSPRQRTGFDDAALLAQLGLDAADGWVPAALVELGDARAVGASDPRRPPAEPAGTTAPADPVVAFDRAAWASGALDDARDRPLPATTADVVAAGARTTWADVVYERSAGRGNKGFTAAPEPLADAVVRAATTALAEALGPQPPPADGGVRALLLSERVQGRPAGLSEIGEGGDLRPLDSSDSSGPGSPGMRAVQRAFSYPETQMSVRSCPAALVLVTDHAGLLDAGGARRLRTSQLDLGAAAQAAGLAMSAHGGFARPARSFDPDVLAADLGLPAGQLPVYVVLLGESRFTDLLVDLRA